MDEIKEWQVQNYRTKACNYLMLYKVAFSFNDEDGLTFTAPLSFVNKMTYSLKVAYGCGEINIIEQPNK